MTSETQWMLSADSHVVEPPELWQRVDREFRDRAPRIEQDENEDWYVVDGVRFMAMSIGALVGKKWEGLEALRTTGHWSDVPAAAYEPDAWLKENEKDGVWGAVLYPTLGFGLFGVPDPRFFLALTRAYNDWAAEFCSASHGRLKVAAIISFDDPAIAVSEMERVRGLGLTTALIPVTPGNPEGYDHSLYDPIWAAAQALEMPLGMHIGAWRVPRTSHFSRRQNAVIRSTSDHSVKVSLTELIFSGVFERFPGLRIGAVEFDAGWVPHWLNAMDDTYHRFYLGNYVHRYRDYEKPSDVWRAHGFVTFSEDPLAVQHRGVIGSDILMWHNDFPHSESTWPRSRQVVAGLTADVPEAERDMLVAGNAARLYGLELPRMAEL